MYQKFTSAQIAATIQRTHTDRSLPRNLSCSNVCTLVGSQFVGCMRLVKLSRTRQNVKHRCNSYRTSPSGRANSAVVPSAFIATARLFPSKQPFRQCSQIVVKTPHVKYYRVTVITAPMGQPTLDDLSSRSRSKTHL